MKRSEQENVPMLERKRWGLIVPMMLAGIVFGLLLAPATDSGDIGMMLAAILGGAGGIVIGILLGLRIRR